MVVTYCYQSQTRKSEDVRGKTFAANATRVAETVTSEAWRRHSVLLSCIPKQKLPDMQ